MAEQADDRDDAAEETPDENSAITREAQDAGENVAADAPVQEADGEESASDAAGDAPDEEAAPSEESVTPEAGQVPVPEPELATQTQEQTETPPPPLETEGAGDEDLDATWAEALSETQGAATESAIKEPAMEYPSNVVPQSAAHTAEFPDLGGGVSAQGAGNIDLLLDVKLPVSIELGRATLPISEILQWGQGSIVELDKLAGEPVNLLVNNKLVAKGEVVVVDENFGLRITSLVVGRDHEEQR